MCQWYDERLAFVWAGDSWTFAIALLSWGLPLAFSVSLESYWSIRILCFYVEHRIE